MTDSIPQFLEKLRILNLVLHHRLEQAEARIPGINDLIQQIVRFELLPETALLGLVIFERHYSALTGPEDSSQLLQAALLIPGGVGVVVWDSEDYFTFRNNPPVNQQELFLKFVPFDQCGSAIKALLLPQVKSLLELLINRFPTPDAGDFC